MGPGPCLEIQEFPHPSQPVAMTAPREGVIHQDADLVAIDHAQIHERSQLAHGRTDGPYRKPPMRSCVASPRYLTLVVGVP